MAYPLFSLGQKLATPGAPDALDEYGVSRESLFRRHVTGDWGDLCNDDKNLNDLALKDGSRIFSAYNIGNGVKVWLITEADRSATTILLPSEY